MLSPFRIVYDLGLFSYKSLIHLASLRNKKALNWIQGRKNIFEKLEKEINNEKQVIWFHCASLGEFEQGRPLLEKLKKEKKDIFIVLSFFSPSGYEIRKNYLYADVTCYLPLDTKLNAEKFIEIIKPQLAIFVKYEFWYHYFQELNKQKIPLILLSAIFRKNQIFFKWYGQLQKEMLKYVRHFFVQDENSKILLQKLGFENIGVVHDTRIDRVLEIADSVKNIELIDDFCKGEKVFIGGSIYEKENEFINEAWQAQLIQSKIILAPHQVDKNHIQNILSLYGDKAILFSDFKNNSPTSKEILIIDNIGMLSSLYQYAKIAFIGGGFGKGIHNILEPAAFGVPIIFGPNYHKFFEAKKLIQSSAAYTVSNTQSFFDVLTFLKHPNNLETASMNAASFIQSHSGGTDIVYQWITENILRS